MTRARQEKLSRSVTDEDTVGCPAAYVNRLHYDNNAIKEGSLAVAPCPLRERQAMGLPEYEHVVSIITPFLSIFVWGIAAPDSSADHGSLRMRVTADFHMCDGHSFDGILGSTIGPFRSIVVRPTCWSHGATPRKRAVHQ